MFTRFLDAEGFLYIALKALRDFSVAFAAIVGADGFTLSPAALGSAALAALGTTAYRVVRELVKRATGDKTTA